MTTYLSSPGKDLLRSKTFWGLVVVVVGMLLGLFGWRIADPGTVTEYLANSADLILQVVGLLVAIWGNVVRKDKITSIAGVRLNR